MRLVYEKRAVRSLAALQPRVAAAIRTRLVVIAANPFAHHANVTSLRGIKDAFRLRHGDWRVGYQIDRATSTMYVEWVKPRREAYR